VNPLDRIAFERDILPGKPIIRGTRLSVEFVSGLLADGWSESDVLRNYPKLVHEDIVACLRAAETIVLPNCEIASARYARMTVGLVVGGRGCFVAVPTEWLLAMT